MINWVEVVCSVMYASSYVGCPCEGHGVGRLWHLLLKPITGGDKQ